LGNFSKNNKKSFFIYGKSTLPRLIEKEYEYYNKLLKNCNWKFIVGNRDKSYNIIDNSKLNITLNSTLGYESFTRGTKTIFFSLRPKKKFLLSLKFGWPAKINNRGYFWTDSLDETYCDKMLFRVIGLNSTKWKKIQSKYNEKLMVSNPNNTKFRSFIKKTVYN
jgi:surface carbohydrate biosynthesis protein